MANPIAPTDKPAATKPQLPAKRGNPFFGVMPIAIMALSLSLFLLLVFIAIQ